MESKDLLVIGGGPGGLTATLRASHEGLDVILAEKNQLGGVCLNTGCIPSKSLAKVADIVYYAQNSNDLGIETNVKVDYNKAVEWSRKNINKLISNIQKSLKTNDVEIKKGKTSFLSSGKAKIGEDIVKFNKAIIATGSKPIELPSIPIDHQKTLTSKDFFELTALPDELIIIGAGYIGMEIGTICRKLGSKVTIVEMLDQILPKFGRRIVFPITKKAKKIGLSINLKSEITEAKINKYVTVTAKYNKLNEIELSADKCLVSIGREPYTKGLGIENTSIKQDEKGFIKTDEQLRTDERNIFAIGDVIGGKMLAHKAYKDAVIAVDSILGKQNTDSVIPEVVFTDPQLAKVGEFKDKYNIGKASFRAVGAAYTKNKPEGLIQIAIDDNGIIRGGQIAGPEASEIIHEVGLAVQNELTVKNLLETVHAHPTLSEGILRAAQNAGESPPYSI